MSDSEFTKLYENAGGPFADYLLALRETGARPKELRDLLWTQVQEDRLVLVNYLRDLDIVCRLAAEHATFEIPMQGRFAPTIVNVR